jgi:hypothetical protein
MNQTMWHVLVESYAIRTREFSDAVALLGRASLPPAQSVKLLEIVNARREACMAAADKLHQYLEQHAPAAKCAVASAQFVNCSEE